VKDGLGKARPDALNGLQTPDVAPCSS